MLGPHEPRLAPDQGPLRLLRGHPGATTGRNRRMAGGAHWRAIGGPKARDRCLKEVQLDKLL